MESMGTEGDKHGHGGGLSADRRRTRSADRRGVRGADWMRQFWCGLHGHDTLLQFEQDRMFLRCVSCGHETPGWDLNDVTPPAAVTARTEVREQPMVRPRLIGVRRVA